MAKRKGTKGQTTIYKTYKAKYRVTRTLLKTGGELRCSGRVGSYCSTFLTIKGTILILIVHFHKDTYLVVSVVSFISSIMGFISNKPKLVTSRKEGI